MNRIIYCLVYSSFSKPIDDDVQRQSNAFVYDLDFYSFGSVQYYGVVVDNRKYSFLRTFEKEDIKDVDSVRKMLHDAVEPVVILWS